MLKRPIVILLGFIGLLVALICTNINGYLINQLAPIDKFPAVYQFLDGRSDLEKLGLMAGSIVVLALVAALVSWLVGKLPEWSAPKELPIATLESGRRMQLIKSQLKEVKKRLKDALERSAMISLEFEDASLQVDKPALDDLKKAAPIVAPMRGIFDRAKKFLTFGKGADAELPQQMKMIEVFRRRDVSGRLLILGHPGAGKTTTLLELAQELLEEAQKAGTTWIPHVFEMSRWEEGLSIVEYLALELKRAPYNLPVEVGRGIAKSGKLLPLLDGLDELRHSWTIRSAMNAINTYLSEDSNRDAVVCCRREDYELARKKLSELNGAIELEPLSDELIKLYLEKSGKNELWKSIERNPRYELLRTPLFLNLFLEIDSPEDIPEISHLWEVYFNKKLTTPLRELSGNGYKRYSLRKEPTQKQTRYYLMFLAKHMKEVNISEFNPYDIKINILRDSRERWGYFIIWGLTYGLLSGLTLFLPVFLVFPGQDIYLIYSFYCVFWGIFWGVLLGLLGYSSKMVIVEEEEVETESQLKQVILDAKFLIGSMVALIIIIIVWQTSPEYLRNEITVLICVPLLVSILDLRLDIFNIILYFNFQKPNDTQTRCIPWNYDRFLSYAADRKLLQQTGGAYRFIHRSLLEHFAGMEN